MAGHMSYEEAKSFVFKGLLLLAAVTLVEVFFSLAGKGHIPFLGVLAEHQWITYVIGTVLVGLSLYKAYFIVYDFMHLRQEVGSMAATILLPMLLLIWAIVAFFQEGSVWGERRQLIADKNRIEVATPVGVSPVELQQDADAGAPQPPEEVLEGDRPL